MKKAALALLFAAAPSVLCAQETDVKPTQIPEPEQTQEEKKEMPYNRTNHFYAFGGAGVALSDDYSGDNFAINGGFGYKFEKHLAFEFDYAHLRNDQTNFEERVNSYSLGIKADQNITHHWTVFGRFSLAVADYEQTNHIIDKKVASNTSYDPVVSVGIEHNFDRVFVRAQYNHYPTNLRSNLNYLAFSAGYRF
ncbi:outer membrane beta-barrel protein [Vibrio sp. D404a]|uniref:outer membrane beta-barrel protein n=1 Tax=unclassified Vibrio TaxID=2614977 RepID=UPI0025565C1F|nr:MULTISPECIES: outer membrane beta-barrel protein [unclassified Vibrio]MDK9739317.1 outer membrane beta-barrel protein [Vibrio sp. D404a]MDK9797648.1 outer membrane beta-barrel protein [Vibrio sp. D449a]